MADKIIQQIRQLALKLQPAAILFLKILLLFSLIKCIFYFYNLQSGQGWQVTGLGNALQLIFWSLIYDAFVIAALFLIPILAILLFYSIPFLKKLIVALTLLMMAGVCTLNLADAFYYPYKLQRSDAELFYVLRNPFQGVDAGYWTYFLLTVAALLCFCLIVYKLSKSFFQQAVTKKSLGMAALFFGSLVMIFCITGMKKLLPTYLLTRVAFYQLPLTQNSIHTFMYSMARLKSSGIFEGSYLLESEDSTVFEIRQPAQLPSSSATGKNIVLFIMESVPYDYFDEQSEYKVDMPFLDSLVKQSLFFENCFSYSHNSNKAITAILSGIPTLTEIPLYHSAYTSIPVTHIGSQLEKQGYSSAFFIGDNYDDFGFAKCARWLGIQNYYCKQDVPGYKELEQHSMGLHDEYVLQFMQQKTEALKPPFFVTNFNISTHVPNDLPTHYLKENPAPAKTEQMKSMQYYSDCLSKFFAEAKTKAWYGNSIFIFVSDHWMYPDMKNQKNDVLQNFRIPLFIFDPQNPQGKRIPHTVSQLDIVNTLLYYSNNNEEFVSYGKNLITAQEDSNRIVYAKENNIIYQAFNRNHVLGFDAVRGEPVFCYNYLQDSLKENNLVKIPNHPMVKTLSDSMRVFLRTAFKQYSTKKIP